MTTMYGLIIEEENRSVPLQDVEVSVSVQGFLANVETSLQYINDSDTDTLEVVYVFPMDDNSAVYKLEANIAGRNITAEVQEKEQARETYDEAVESGHSAVLMEEHDSAGDIFRCKLGNLPPNSKADIKFSFVTEMSLETDESLKFVLPTVLNPRYNPSPEDGASKTDTTFSGMVTCHYNLTCKGSVSSKHGISRVWSETDELRTTLVTLAGSINRMEFQVDGPSELDHDISFQVLYENSHKPQTALEKGAQDKEGLMRMDLLMLSFYPHLTSPTSAGSTEFIFVIDRSSSMRNKPIRSAREAMMFFLKSLPVDCYFNIVCFGSLFVALFPEGSNRYSQRTLEQAMGLQATLEADFGGTNILRPIQFVYSTKAPPGYSRQIFLLTDGEVGNSEEVVTLVKRNSKDSRVFTVGIGDGVSTSLVRNVAKAGGGEAEFVTDTLNLQQKVMKLLKAACQPCVTDIALDLELPSGLTADLMLPKDMPVIFSGQRTSLFVFLGGKASTSKGKAHLSGKISGCCFKHSLEFDLQTEAIINSGQFVHRMAMKGLIKDLEMENELRGEKKREIIVASTASNLISKYTSFVGVDKERNIRATKAVERHVAPPPKQHMSQAISQPLATTTHDSNQDAKKSSKSRSRFSPRKLLSKLIPSFNKSQPVPSVRDVGWKDPTSAPRRYRSTTYMVDRSTEPTLASTNFWFSSPDGDSYGPNRFGGRKSSLEFTFSSQAADMVLLQSFDGSWELDSSLSAVIDVSEDDLVDSTTNKDKKVLATCAAVCWLTLRCSEERSVWEMVVDKAKQWLLRTVGDQQKVDELMKEVQDAFF